MMSIDSSGPRLRSHLCFINVMMWHQGSCWKGKPEMTFGDPRKMSLESRKDQQNLPIEAAKGVAKTWVNASKAAIDFALLFNVFCQVFRGLFQGLDWFWQDCNRFCKILNGSCQEFQERCRDFRNIFQYFGGFCQDFSELCRIFNDAASEEFNWFCRDFKWFSLAFEDSLIFHLRQQ